MRPIEVTGTTSGTVLRRTAILLAAATLAAGCTASSPSKAAPGTSRTAAGSAATAGPVAAAVRRVHCGRHRQQASIPLPAGFVADAAVRCDLTVRLLHGRGRVVYHEQVADRGLAPLVAALRRPSERPAPDVACPVQAIIMPLLFLIDRDGRIIRPVIPRDVCWQPQQQALDALQRVPWVTAHSTAVAR